MGDGLEREPTRVLATGQEEACWGAQAEDDGERSRRAALQLQRGGSAVQGLAGALGAGV